jgi:hypothetical protein
MDPKYFYADVHILKRKFQICSDKFYGKYNFLSAFLPEIEFIFKRSKIASLCTNLYRNCESDFFVTGLEKLQILGVEMSTGVDNTNIATKELGITKILDDK